MIWTLRMKSHLISNRLLNIREELTEITEFKEPQMQLASSYLSLVLGRFSVDYISLQFRGFRSWAYGIVSFHESYKPLKGIETSVWVFFLEHFTCIPQAKVKAQLIKLYSTWCSYQGGHILENTFIAYGLPENTSMSFIYNEMSCIFRRLSNHPDFFYKVRLLKEHRVAFWSDNIRGVQQLTGRQQNQEQWLNYKEFLS